MDAFACQGVQVAGKDCHQGLAFAGFHFRDPALVQDNAAQKLYRVGPQADNPVGCLPDGGKGFREQVVQGFAVFQPGFERRCLSPKFLVGKLLIGFFQGEDLIQGGLELFYFPLGAGAENFCNQSHGKESSFI